MGLLQGPHQCFAVLPGGNITQQNWAIFSSIHEVSTSSDLLAKCDEFLRMVILARPGFFGLIFTQKLFSCFLSWEWKANKPTT